MESKTPLTLRIGIDIGGTFTDFVIFNPATGSVQTFKLPSTPDDPSRVVLEGLERIDVEMMALGSKSEGARVFIPPYKNIIHGSTVATNALLERKGAKTALLTTKGFKDILQIGRQNRPDLYDFATKPPEPLILEGLRFEVDERVNSHGEIMTVIRETQIDEIITKLERGNNSEKVTSIAVVYLFSFLKPDHEIFTAKKLREAGYFVSASHEVLPEYREYERTSTTVVNAYVSPVLDKYLKKLEFSPTSNSVDQICENATIPPSSKPTSGTSIQIMQSNGGCISVREARENGVRCIFSGPAGGVVGSKFIGQIALEPTASLKLLTFDMGGTSTDVSLIDGDPKITSESQVGGHPIRVPILDIHTIGAGGGSIAYKDVGGVLRVGPESAGAEPGPACYGKQKGDDGLTHTSLLPTVTDANLLLGRIPPDEFLGGEIPLFPEFALKAIETLGNQINLDPYHTALGIIEIANAHMERALRVISVERGYDPREFILISFGGAGGLHAADLARRLSIPKVLIPPFAATLSAFGMLTADVIKDYTQTVMLPGNIPNTDLQARFDPLITKGYHQIEAEGFTATQIRIESFLDMRYRGQSFELTIPYLENIYPNGDIAYQFGQAHLKAYGYDRPGVDLEIVNLRVRATGIVSPPKLTMKDLDDSDPGIAQINFREVVFPKGVNKIPCYRAELLNPGNIIEGPAIVLRKDTTILIGRGDITMVDTYGNLIINVRKNGKTKY